MARAPQPANLRATRLISAAFWPFYPRLPGAYALENADKRGNRPWTCNTNSRQAATTHTGKVHQHGSPTRIQSWANNTRRRLRAAGAQQEANDIVVVSGPLPVDELNKCLWVSGYVRRMFSRLATLPHGKLQRPAEPFRKAA